MRNRSIIFLIVLLKLILPFREASSSSLLDCLKSTSVKTKHTGAFDSGVYQNLFTELSEKNESHVNCRIDSAFNQLFYGDNQTQRIYYPVEPDMAYIEDIGNQDVRTEGMSYGMMIAVQLNKKNEFDRLWKWAKTYMQHQSGASKDYFAWHCKDDGTKISVNSASDGEEWFVMALFFASARWGDGEGIFAYKAEAQKILDAMLGKTEASDRTDVITNMFNKKEKQVVFVPVGNADDFTDPSYHVPHFYELWSRWSDKNNQFWRDVADTSRQFLKKAVHLQTGLAPDYARFDGSPLNPFWGGGHKDFRFDAWRVAMNVAVDYQWFARDEWAIEQSNRLLNFFYSQGIEKYINQYALDGKPLSTDRNAGLIAMNAVAALASTNENRKEFVEELWNLSIPSGHWRYYDGMLYLLALLQVSGNFRIYEPNGFSENNYKSIKISNDIELIKISENAYLHISYTESPQFGRFPSNGLIFINNQKAFLFDTPMTESLTKDLVSWVQDSMHIQIVGFIPNHWHDDCMGGLDYIHSLGIESYANELTREIARAKNLPIPKHGFTDSVIFKLGDKEIVCRYFGAAHTVDNIVVWIPSEQILFGGCMIKEMKSTGLGNIADGDVKAWPKTIKKVLDEFPNAKIVIPGHGQIGDLDLIRHTLELLKSK
jgi:oligosaccharide reducing-end xylanase